MNILICSALTDNFALSNLYLMLINAMLVTFTATGGYDFAVKSVTIKNEKDKELKK